VHQQHSCHGGELLGERGEAEVSAGVDRGASAQVAEAVAALEDRAPVLTDENGYAGRAGAGERLEDRVEPGGGRVAGGRGCGYEQQTEDRAFGHVLDIQEN